MEEIQNKKRNSKTGNGGKVLIPVDFSPKCSLALRIGFELANRLESKVVLLHASVMAEPTYQPQFPYDVNGIDDESAEIEEIEIDREIHEIDEHSMHELKAKILSMQTAGTFPCIEFDAIIASGMPEEVISEYCSANPPEVIVMATRGCEKRKEELIGSVTAEVIDHSVGTVLTVPEDYTFAGFKDIVRICAFCFCDDSDVVSIGRLMDMFDRPSVKIYLFPATDKFKGIELQQRLSSLQLKLKNLYPNSEFFIALPDADKKLRDAAEEFFIKDSIQMILAPNRRRNAIARFFNPGLAHKILYEIDFPMLAIPV